MVTGVGSLSKESTSDSKANFHDENWHRESSYIQNEWSTIADGELLPQSLRECSNLLRSTKKYIHRRSKFPAQGTRTSTADYYVSHAF
jgi:hypothetical protein